MNHQLITTADGSHSVFVPQLNEHYHSIHGAIQESEHVFINAGLQQLPQDLIAVQLLEIGFGTGLNTFLTYLANLTNIQRHITYTALEAYPLNTDLALQLNYVQQLNAQPHQAIFTALHTCPWQQQNTLALNFTLLKQQALLQNLQFAPQYHLIYFDAFAPAAQPELWTASVFEQMYRALLPGGILCTYCAKGIVKRTLKEVGFTVESLPGPPGKRQMTRARKE